MYLKTELLKIEMTNFEVITLLYLSTQQQTENYLQNFFDPQLTSFFVYIYLIMFDLNFNINHYVVSFSINNLKCIDNEEKHTTTVKILKEIYIDMYVSV